MKSPIQTKDLDLKTIPKGTAVICYACGTPVVVQIDVQISKDEVILCHPCAEANTKAM